MRPSTDDLMSYCGPQWISDYNFTKALRFRLSDADNEQLPRLASPAKSLLLWGGTGADSAPFLEPAFVVEAPPAAARLGGRMAAGRTDLRRSRALQPVLRHARGRRRGERFRLRLRAPGAPLVGENTVEHRAVRPRRTSGPSTAPATKPWRSSATRGPARCGASCAICPQRCSRARTRAPRSPRPGVSTCCSAGGYPGGMPGGGGKFTFHPLQNRVRIQVQPEPPLRPPQPMGDVGA